MRIQTEGAGAAPMPAQGGGGGSSTLKIVLGVGCGCAVLFALLFAGIFFVAMKATEGPVKEVEAFLEKTTNGDVEGAYEHFSISAREELALEAFRGQVERNPSFYQVESVSFSNRSVENDRAKLVGTITSKSGAAQPCAFGLVEENGVWKIYMLTENP